MTARDTSEEAGAAQREALRRLGGKGRIALAFAMTQEARDVATAGIQRRHPELSCEEARSRLLRRLLGDALWRAAYGQRKA